MQTEKEYTAAKEVNSLRCESVGEYSLPDYNGDVKKVLLVNTKVYPSGKFVGEDSLEFSGSVGYNVVYVDGENKVTHAEFSTDYDAAIKINSENYLDSDVQTCVSSCNLRLIGPRKFSVKSTLDSNVCVSERRVSRIEGDAFMEFEPEYISNAVNVMSMAFGTSDAREINEEILSLDGAIADEVEVLVCDVTDEIDVFDKTESGMTLRGDIRVGMLYRDSSDRVLRTEKVIPYSEDVSFDCADEFEDLRARLEKLSIKGSVEPVEDGVKLCVSMSVAPRVCGKKNSFLSLAADAFLKERATVNEYVDFNYTEHICTETCEEKYEVRQVMSELDLDDISDVLYSDASVRVDSSEICDNSVKISGEIKFSAMACQVSEDGTVSCVPVKFSAPFEQNVNINCQIHDNMRVNCHTEAKDVRMEAEENHFTASCVLCSAVGVKSDRNSRCLGSSYVTDEEYVRDESVVTVYYPDASESLFGIAKKFHTSVSAIAESNRFTEAVFASSSMPLGNSGIGKIIIK